MPYYKNTNNELFFLDDAKDLHYLPENLTAISEAEKDAIINTPAKLKQDANNIVLAQIAALEARVTARVWREYISKPAVAGKGGKTPAQFITDIDTQIATLRGTLIA